MFEWIKRQFRYCMVGVPIEEFLLPSIGRPIDPSVLKPDKGELVLAFVVDDLREPAVDPCLIRWNGNIWMRRSEVGDGWTILAHNDIVVWFDREVT